MEQILKYWYEQEFFNPCWPVETHKDIYLKENLLPWLTPQTNPRIRVSYDIYFGNTFSSDLIIWMLNELNMPLTEEIEPSRSSVCLCALKVDEHGMYVENSFSISTFVWAICKLVSSSSFHTKLNISDFEDFQQKVEQKLLYQKVNPTTPIISLDDLKSMYSFVCDSMHLKKELFTQSFWAKVKTDYINKIGEFPPLDSSTELFSSFYLKDMEKVRKNPTPKVQEYIHALLQPDSHIHRIQIDTDIEEMKKWLQADKFPLGAWPSSYSPSLMQQLGINIAVSNEQDVFSINGPPGTGKTTLLKEIITSNIIQRAFQMASYDYPDQAFSESIFQNPLDLSNLSYYRIDDKLTAYGMIVASNNNAAVENISVELPLAISRDRTMRFSGIDMKIEDTYFSDIATKLSGESAWGLISAKLGKNSNLKALQDRLWWAKDGVTLRRYYNEEIAPDWNVARQNFNKALQAVMQMQKNIAQAQELLTQEKQAKIKFQILSDELDHFKINFEYQNRLKQANADELNRLKQTKKLQQENIDMFKSQLNFFKLYFWKLFKKDPVIYQWKQTEIDIGKTVIAIAERNMATPSLDALCNEAKRKLDSHENLLQNAELTLNAMKKKIDSLKLQFKGNWADDEFWENICNNQESQTACPWTHEEYNMLREELFYQALMLNKAFVLSSKHTKTNLEHLFALWNGNISVSDRNKAYGSLLNTLLLVIPVISTTFASVQTFLGGINPEEIGVLVIDEAGQATPQSALGALWRSKKAIIVGDPLQVEPIVTIPKELKQRLADENGISSVYRSPEISVQTLADRLNVYGGVRKLEEKELWLGCPLVVHRRCLNPMFQISNEIAYGGRMFLKTPQPDSSLRFLLSESIWFDVKGAEKGHKNHSVKEQTDKLVNLFVKAIHIYQGLPELYIITPFTSVAYAIQRTLLPLIQKELPELDELIIKDWLKKNCGTIHTFQGKEANEILLVLGCDKQSGKGAAHWVGMKPNIINVAVSRAKYRLGVIGDYDLWKSIPYVKDICRILPLQR
ncbi:DEAD/DEAH box helicase [Faecalispora anaeroviscerum]|uniref:DEAD/DEAH box helicase n=1 Tax=Faecalispora anaeroviscerum TaxID=2991836 RepID=UPI0024BA0DCC|nr:AAA domain-containing protein [Faecalispora anaeroviscerum]